MSTEKLDQAFDTFLKESQPSGAIRLREVYWLAFKAGAEWALGEFRECMNKKPAQQKTGDG